MPTRYFCLREDLDAPRRWFLGDVDRELMPLLKATPVDLARWEGLTFTVDQQGEILDITFTHYLLMVVRPAVGELIERLAPKDIQRIPATVEGVDEQFEILNVLTMRDCLDTKRSDMENPIALGKVLRAEAIGDASIFRVQGLRMPIFVSEPMGEALAAQNLTGFELLPMRLSK